MRSQHRRRAAALLAAVAATAGLSLGAGLGTAPVVAAECPGGLAACIVVKVVGTVDGTTTVLSTYTVAPTDLQAWSDEKPDLNTRQYALRKNPESKGGKIQRRPIAQGKRVGLNALLTKLDPQLVGTATYLETPNAAGVPAVLSDADLADPDAPPTDADGDGKPDTVEYPFFEKLQPAVFVTTSGRLGYIRPLRDLEEDTNAADYFQVTGRLDLTVHTTGTLLEPTVSSSGGTALDKGAETTFSVSWATKPRTEITSTTWDFGDGSVRGTKRAEPAKSYAKRGTFAVAVAVRGKDGSYGRSAGLEVKVANPPKAPSSGSGGGDGLGGSGGGGVTSPLPSVPYDPLPDLTPPDDVQPPAEPEPVPQLPVDDGLEPVEGYVLAGAEIVPGGTPVTIPGTQASSTPAPATQESRATRIATWAVAAIAIALLVGVGAASETRWFHRLRHLRRRA